jgi:hypothetical protein
MLQYTKGKILLQQQEQVQEKQSVLFPLLHVCCLEKLNSPIQTQAVRGLILYPLNALAEPNEEDCEEHYLVKMQ